MNESKRFSKESSIYVVGEILSKALTFMLLPIYTRYLSIEEYAFLNMVMVIWPIVLILIGQAFTGYIIRGYFEYEDKKKFVGTIFSYAMSMGLLMAFIIHVSGPWLCDFLFRQIDYYPYLKYAVILGVFRLFFALVLGVFQAKRQAKTVVKLTVFLFASHLVAVLITIFALHGNLIDILNAQLIAYGFIALFYLIRIIPEISFRVKLRWIVPGILFTLPLIPHALSGWTINYVSRIFIERFMSITDLAVYGVAMQLALIMAILNMGLNKAWNPFVYHNYTKPDFKHLFQLSAQKMIVFVFLVGTGLTLFIQEVLHLMGKTDYLLAKNIIPILILAYLFQIIYFIYIVIIIYHKKTKFMPFISILSGILCIGTNIFLIPRIGMYGAAVSTLVSFMLMAFLARSLSHKFFKAQLMNKKLVFFFILTGMILIISLFLLDGWNRSMQFIGKGVLLMILLWVVDKTGLFKLKDIFILLFSQ